MDSAAAIGTVHRRGNGKLRHVRVGTLWVQERVEEGDLAVKKVKGEDNPADLCTKHLATAKVMKFMAMIQFDFREGRADTSLVLPGQPGDKEESEQKKEKKVSHAA